MAHREAHLDRSDRDQWIDVAIGGAALLLVLVIAFLLLSADATDPQQGTPARTPGEATATK